MKSLRLRNYRCFEDTGNIEFKPVNVLLGSNSSGKSSFLKFFPLLKQSRLRHSNGPFLWYADDVDFRDFKNTVRNGEGQISIDMDIQLARVIAFKGLDRNVLLHLSLTVDHFPNSQSDYLSNVYVTFNGTTIELKYKYQTLISIVVNGVEEKVDSRNLSADDFIPICLFKGDEKDVVVYSNEIPGISTALFNLLEIEENKFGYISEKLLFRFGYLGINDLINFLRNDSGLALYIPEEKANQIGHYYYLSGINSLIRDINSFIDVLARNVSYIQPLRAYAKRYSRFQNISVEEIDSHGENLPMYLYSLDSRSMKELNEWLGKNFDFNLQLPPSEGHIEIIITDKEGHFPRNLVDIGFGYSQLLPIIVQIWAVAFKRNNSTRWIQRRIKTPKYIVIEQPELHLHPSLMRKFARMLASIINDTSLRNQIVFIVETHSVALIEEIGIMLAQKEDLDIDIKKEDYQILMFNTSKDRVSTIEKAEYNNEGMILNWPYGFLS